MACFSFEFISYNILLQTYVVKAKKRKRICFGVIGEQKITQSISILIFLYMISFFFLVTDLVYKSRTKKINYLQCSTIDFHETKNFFDICYWYRLTVLCSMRLISNNAEHKQSTDKIAIKSLIQIMSLISLSNICNKGTSGIRLILLWRKFLWYKSKHLILTLYSSYT